MSETLPNTEDREPIPQTEKPKVLLLRLPPIIHLDFQKKTVLFIRSRERQQRRYINSFILIDIISNNSNNTEDSEP
jgi:hypothetical protein